VDIFDNQFFINLLSIIAIDIVLGGDNAILIALATRKLSSKQRNKAIFWGVFGAVAVRAGLTAVAVYVLQIPLIQFVGGVLLVWIAFKLLVDEGEHDNVKSGANLREAIKTIIIADLLMGIDNVLAVAGAAHGDPLLVVLGLLISVPIIVWGSTLILRLIERFPFIIFIGAGIIAWTAGGMIIEDEFIQNLFFKEYHAPELIVPIMITAIVLGYGYLKRRKLS